MGSWSAARQYIRRGFFQGYPANFPFEAQLRVDRQHRGIIGRVPCLQLPVAIPSCEIDDFQLQRDRYTPATIFSSNTSVSLDEASRLLIETPDSAQSNILGTVLCYHVCLGQETRVLEFKRLPLLIRDRCKGC